MIIISISCQVKETPKTHNNNNNNNNNPSSNSICFLQFEIETNAADSLEIEATTDKTTQILFNPEKLQIEINHLDFHGILLADEMANLCELLLIDGFMIDLMSATSDAFTIYAVCRLGFREGAQIPSSEQAKKLLQFLHGQHNTLLQDLILPYDRIKNDLDLYQPSACLLSLHSYQKQTISWMLEREGFCLENNIPKEIPKLSWLIPLFDDFVFNFKEGSGFF
jgi:hypothetical protein